MPGFGNQSAQNAAAVSLSDTVDLPGGVCRALYVGTAGDIALIPAGGSSSVTFTAVPVGILPVAVKRVLSTATTASHIVALY